jgi:oligopeptide/dipeptide ABC transporter ATP-binding protein
VDDILQINDLTVRFETDDGILTAVDSVSLGIRKGEVLGLVGESGSGKSVTALSILRLIPSPPGRIESGQVLYEGQDLLRLPIRELRKFRGSRISMIFQEPMTALSPLHRIGNQMVETLRLHENMARPDAIRRSIEWLGKVGMPDPEQRMRSYPYQLSGGMRQRVMIAMALMLSPALVIADEPTTALDVTIQAQIFDLIIEMKQDDTSVLLITHDMGVIWEMCNRVAVMYASEIVETAPIEALFARPAHPYTEALLASMPALDSPRSRLEHIPGNVPSALDYPSGCHFRERCRYAAQRCERQHPSLYPTSGGNARCFKSDPKDPLTESIDA